MGRAFLQPICGPRSKVRRRRRHAESLQLNAVPALMQMPLGPNGRIALMLVLFTRTVRVLDSRTIEVRAELAPMRQDTSPSIQRRSPRAQLTRRSPVATQNPEKAVASSVELSSLQGVLHAYPPRPSA